MIQVEPILASDVPKAVSKKRRHERTPKSSTKLDNILSESGGDILKSAGSKKVERSKKAKLIDNTSAKPVVHEQEEHVTVDIGATTSITADPVEGDSSSVESDGGEEGGTAARSKERKRHRKHDKDLLARTKPDPMKDKAKDRALLRVATRGVVQLFNLVKEQSSMSSDLFAGDAEKAKQRSVFLEKLKKRTAQEDGPKKWKVLTDDFLLDSEDK